MVARALAAVAISAVSEKWRGADTLSRSQALLILTTLIVRSAFSSDSSANTVVSITS